MITEETITQTRFYHGLDGQDYLVREVRDVKIVTLINCSDGEPVDMILGDDVCRQFAPVTVQYMPVDQLDGPATPIEGPAAPRKVTNATRAARIAARIRKDAGEGPKNERKPGRNKKSIYKGVSPTKPTLAGVVRFNAVYWDGKKKRAISLGTYARELEAAAVYQDHAGNKAKAAEYRRMDKQQMSVDPEPPGTDMAKPKHVAGHRGPLKKVSRYKGVSLCKQRKNGRQKWRVQFCDKGKVVSLGAYHTELEAAAVYQDHIGDKGLAAEYRRMDAQQQGKQDNLNTTPDAIRQRRADAAEQAENNPDRTEKVKMVTIWRCSHCKVETKSEPVRCNHCDSASFKTKRVPADSV